MNKWAGFLNSFLEIDKLDKRRREYRNLGWIYVVRNPMYKDTRENYCCDQVGSKFIEIQPAGQRMQVASQKHREKHASCYSSEGAVGVLPFPWTRRSLLELETMLNRVHERSREGLTPLNP